MRTTVVVIGAGQAGLAMSRCLTDRAIDHVVLEKGDVAHSWRTERWDSLRLLTPTWLTRLPGLTPPAAAPDGYLHAREVVDLLDGYRRSCSAPVQTDTTVTAVTSTGTGHVVHTDQGPWHCDAVVFATGAASHPRVPALHAELPSRIRQLPALRYRNPGQLDDGPVLVVGASASGVQIASELQRAGREVVLAAGEHTRLPRTYRGQDVHWWLDALGHLDERHDEVEDLARARRQPSLQLVGSDDRRSIGLDTLAAEGVQVVGRLVGVTTSRLQHAGSLANQVTSADLKLHRLLDRVDEHVRQHGWEDRVAAPDRPAPVQLPVAPTELPVDRIATVVWATGYRAHHPWLDASHLDRKGQVMHDGGVLPCPGLYVLGLPFQRRRSSAFIDGVGRDAEELSDHLLGHLARRVRAAA